MPDESLKPNSGLDPLTAVGTAGVISTLIPVPFENERKAFESKGFLADRKASS